MVNQRQPVLELSTLAPTRPIITIDGQRFEVAVTGDFGILDSHKLDALQPIVTAYQQENATADDIAAFADALHTFTQLVLLNAPQEVVEKLTEAQMLQVIGVFTDASASTESDFPRRRRSWRFGRITSTTGTPTCAR